MIMIFNNLIDVAYLLDGGPYDKMCGGENEERAGEEEGEVDRRHQEARPRALAESRCYPKHFEGFQSSQISYIQQWGTCYRV